MDINILSLSDGAKVAKGIAVIIDVYRAFTTQSFAFENGVKDILNVPNVSFETISLYESQVDKKYDIALGLGLLHRVPDIERCIEYLGNIADTLILEFKMFKDSRNICYDPKQETKSNEYNKLYGLPTKSFVETRMNQMGFKYNVFKFDKKSHLNYPRTILVSSKEKH